LNRLRQYQRRANAWAGLRIICAINKSSKAIRIAFGEVSSSQKWGGIPERECRPRRISHATGRA
jgi:hypothetical protein